MNLFNFVKMELILRNFRENLGSILYSTLLHYINGCSSAWSNPLRGKINALLSLMIALSAFSEKLVEVSADSLQQICGQDQDILFQLVNLVSLTFAQYTSLLVSLRKLFDCSVWSPIYTSIAYDGKQEDNRIEMFVIHVSHVKKIYFLYT